MALINREKLASIGEIAAGVGHEINNPLAIIVGNVNVIKNSLSADNIINERISNSLLKIELSNNRIKKIVDGLRTYSRTDSDNFEIISLGEAVSQTIFLVEEIYLSSGVSLSVEIEKSSLFMMGNIGKLQQIIMNLLSNAKDATEGKLRRQISIHVYNHLNHQVVLKISDNGTGIPQKIIDKIFNPFFTTKEFGKGTGIGLGLVNEFVKAMNGNISVQSTIDVGSLFTINFPHSINQINEKTVSENEQTKLSGNVLVVDDEPDILEILSDNLKELGLTVDTALNGQIALLMFENKKYDYVCTDFMMPELNGKEFIKLAKKLNKSHETKFYIISGGILSQSQNSAIDDLESLIDGFIQKPFTPESIYQVLKSKS